MHLRLIIERVAVVIFQPLLQRPRDDVPQGVKIEVQIERDTVIEPDALVINRLTADEAETERYDFAVLSPDKKPCTVRHPLSNGSEIIFGQRLKFQWRSLVDGHIQ